MEPEPTSHLEHVLVVNMWTDRTDIYVDSRHIAAPAVATGQVLTPEQQDAFIGLVGQYLTAIGTGQTE